MYEKELLPSCIVMGITPEQFWRLNPRLLEPYYEAERLKERRMDSHMWVMGAYVTEALGVALANAFSGKRRKKVSYRDKPFMEEAREARGDFTEEEKIERTKSLFRSLEIMQRNYERSNESGH